MDIIRIGAKPEQGWTTEPALPEYKLKAEAEKDDRQWPLEIGDLVEVQCFDPVDANGLVGEIMKPYTTAHCYTVRFTKADGGTATTEYHAMYLTRLQFLQGQ